MLSKPGTTVKRARELRRQMSLPEIVLWQQLRRRPGDLKFRRQHPAGPFVLDFYCAEAGLCLEIDGESHSRGDQPEFDAHRDAALAAHGIATLRIAAKDVLGNLEVVIDHLVHVAKLRLPLHQPSAGPPPQALLGED